MYLDVDVAAVRFEPRAVASATVRVIDREVHAIAVHGMAAGCERAKVGVGEEAEGALEERVQGRVACNRVEDHRAGL